MKTFINNQFHRWNDNIDKNAYHHDDVDRHTLYENDNLERMKPFQMDANKAEDDCTVVPIADDDGLYEHYDLQGESAWTNPPDPNKPLIDHGLDELNVWAHRRSLYNQDVITNHYSTDLWGSMEKTHHPWWGLKLAAPCFYTDERMATFQKQWGQRIGLELLKIQHSEQDMYNPNTYARQKAEVQAYLQKVEQDNIEDEWSDVYVTDHKKPVEKLLTHNDEEAEAFYKYKQSLAAYKADAPKPVVPRPKRKYEKGSLQQRLFDPLADATKDADGCLNYTVEDKELLGMMQEDRLKRQFEAFSNQMPIDGALDEDDDDLRIAIWEENELVDLPVDEWNDMLDKELSVFKKGKKYDFVEDLQDAYKQGLKTPLADKILETIPEHVFFDIKKPLHEQQDVPMNKYNPARKVAGSNFFDMRKNYAYFKERDEKNMIAPSVSLHVDY